MSAVIEHPGITHNGVSTPATLLELAVNRGADVEQLSKLMDLHERWNREEARKAYNAAKRAVESEVPRIEKDGRNETTSSSYSRIETINKALVPIYTKHGFTLSFSEGVTDKEGHIRIICDVSHIGGHSETKWVDLPLDNVGLKGTVNKTGVHATGSTLSYGRRYLTCLIFNISTGDDDDGQESGKGAMEEQANQIARLITHNATVRNWIDSIQCIKTCIATQQWQRAVEAWLEVPDDDKAALWIAPTKGGIFTTAEIAAFKCNEWAAARREIMGTAE